jgi:ABC-2 type transport system ATP-binding protein
MSETLLQASDLAKTFGETTAVIDLNLEVHAGEIYGLVGPDGAGKTTLIRMLVGAMLPDKGEVTIRGYDMLREPDQAREQIGYLSQRFSLYEDLTVLENLRFFAEVRGFSPGEWRPRILETLEFVGLSEFVDRQAGQLSGGMKQKLGLATALVHQPILLLLDEPTGGVDPVTRQDFWQLIIRVVAEEGVGVLVSTPYMDEVMRCGRVGMMMGGHLVLEGPPETLRRSLGDHILELRGAPITALRRVTTQDSGVEDVQTFGDRLHLRVEEKQVEQVMKRLKTQAGKEGIELKQIKRVEPQLEDVFMALIAENQLTGGLVDEDEVANA